MNSDGSRAVCYVCGLAAYPVYIIHNKQRPGQDDQPWFPFLATHEKPAGANLPDANGGVQACTLCYSILINQWEVQEREKVPPASRYKSYSETSLLTSCIN